MEGVQQARGSQSGSWTSSISITWELVSDASLWAPTESETWQQGQQPVKSFSG